MVKVGDVAGAETLLLDILSETTKGAAGRVLVRTGTH